MLLNESGYFLLGKTINNVWNNLINQNKLRGSIAKSNILHIGDKNVFEGL